MKLDFDIRLNRYAAENKYRGIDFIEYRELSNIGLVDKNCISFNDFINLNDRLGSSIAQCYKNQHFFNIYISPIADLLKTIDADQVVPVLIGDTDADDFLLPVLGKARVIGSKNITILKLNKPRHWGGDYKSGRFDNRPLSLKSLRCVWRGVPTGDWFSKGRTTSRFKLFEKYGKINSDLIDFGLSAYEPSTRIRLGASEKIELVKWIKGKLSINEMLEYAFILSLEGNDVSTSLKWILASNSIPVMPSPIFESWLLEGLLIDGFHYISVDLDKDDLVKTISDLSAWGGRLKEISANGKIYMEMFVDDESERLLEIAVIRNFLGL
ncbi:hypothetical protein [Limnohabitans sp.]|uniref:hypothetical protein n=1 Tax=Limnohabitans sp. TaxID=1907725 RepID=UPI0038BAC307